MIHLRATGQKCYARRLTIQIESVQAHDNSLWVVAGNSWPLMNDVWKLAPPRVHVCQQIKN
jgi:hypothetical protein